MCDLMNDELLLEDDLIPLFQNDTVITFLNSQLEQLTINSNTNELQLKIDRAKRKKTNLKIKLFKKEIRAKPKVIQDLHDEIDQIKYNVEIYRLLWIGESSHLRTIAY